MSIFKKLFNRSQKPNEEGNQEDNEQRSKYMPERVELPVDERFIHHFTNLGGRFLYCIDQDEVNKNFELIVDEDGLRDQKAFCLDPALLERFSSLGLSFTEDLQESSYLITTCEYVIADSGAILFSSNQVKQFKPNELPATYIVFASASQIVESIGEGLRGIKVKNQEKIPTNITTLKNFELKETSEEKDLMNYGTPSKRVYLLLLEDL